MAQRILVVENDDKEWNFLSDLFSARGAEPVRAGGYQEALEHVRGKPQWDLIVIEALLPKRSGSELCLDIKGTPEGRDTPVLLIGSIFKNFKLAQQAKFKFKADDLLIKPFTLDDLEEKLAIHLDGLSPEQLREIQESRGRKLEVDAALPGQIALAGSLEAVPLGRLLAWVAELRETGVLTVTSGEASQSVSFVRGQPVYSMSVACGESLGQMLLRKGVIDRRTLETCLRSMIDTGKRQGETLLQMGSLTSHQLYEALSEHVFNKIVGLFGWRSGGYSFRLLEQAPGADLSLKIDLASVIFEGIKLYYSPQALQEEFDGLAKLYVHRVRGGPFQMAGLKLGLSQKRYCQAIDGTMTVAALLRTEELSEFEERALLLTLIFLGSVKLDARSSSEHPHPTGIPYIPPDTAKERAINDYVESTDSLYDRLREAPDSSALGVREGAAPAQVRDSLLGSVAALHDRQIYPRAPGLTRAKADSSILKLFAAYGRLTGASAQEGAREEKAPGIDGSASEDLLRADLEFESGRTLLDEGRHRDAQEAFGRAARLDQRRGQYVAWAGWALFCASLVSSDIHQLAEAEEKVQRALMLDPHLAIGHLFIGRMAKNRGDLDAAQSALELAADLCPDDIETLIELQEIYAGRRTAQPAKRDEKMSEQLKGYISHIEAWYRAQSGKNFIELLGLSPSDTIDQARRNYFDLAENIRPQNLYSESPILIQEMADEIFQRLTEAYEIFSDPIRRDGYLKEIEPRSSVIGDDGGSAPRSEEADRLSKRAQSLHAAGEYKAAGALFKRAHLAAGGGVMDLVRQGECLYKDFSGHGLSRTEAAQKAKRIINDALQADMSCGQAHAVLGRIFIDEHKIELAEEELSRALKLDPENLDALRGFRLLHSGQWHQRRRAQARAQTDAMHELRQKFSNVYSAMFSSDFFKVLDVSSKDSDEDVERSRRRREKEYAAGERDDDPQSDLVVMVLSAEISRRISDAFSVLSSKDGREAYEVAVERRGEIARQIDIEGLMTARECIEAGWKLLREKKLDLAEQSFDRATRLAPGSGPALGMLAWCRWQNAGQGQAGADARNSALELSKSASRVDSEAWEVWYAQGMIHKLRDDRKEALRCLTRAAELDPNNAEIHNELSLLKSRTKGEKASVLDSILNRIKGFFKRGK